ncbi:MAG: hypothetical protein J6W96_01245, partial [Alphaproteobacteria bacterium]|nr:hypothetical protein [Alphaproteobacteria bacterium]
MQDRLSIKNVYESASLYVVKHIFAFVFLVAFYYLGNLLPIFIGTTSFKLLMIPYYYLFLYFAAGCYYKQQIIWDRHIFLSAGLRFLTAILLFFAAILISNSIINHFLEFLRTSFTGGNLVVKIILHSTLWQIVKYAFIFMLFIIFFV